MRDADVIVIGAGAAGLAAAVELSRAGLDVLILEARSRPGGRIHTVRAQGWPVPIELGPEFIHGQPPETWTLARDSGALVEEIPNAQWIAGPAGLRRLSDFWGQMEKITAMIPSQGPDVSFQEFLRRRRGVSGPQRRLALQFVSGFHAAEIGRISARSLSTRRESPSEPADRRQHRVVSGQDAFVEALWSEARRGKSRLRLGSPVLEVRWKSGRVSVRTRKSGRTQKLQAAAAIVTVPLGVLKAAAGRTGAIRFLPEITAKRRAIEGLEMGHVFRIVLRFREAFWEEQGFLEERLAAGTTARDPRFAFLQDPHAPFPTWWSALPSRVAMLTGWVGGDGALPFLGRSAAELSAAAVQSLAKTLNVRGTWLTKRLLRAHLHDWNSDPYARGAYSYVAVGAVGAGQRLSRPLSSTLFFAGEATDSEQSGTVAGAIASGRRAAGQLLRSR